MHRDDCSSPQSWADSLTQQAITAMMMIDDTIDHWSECLPRTFSRTLHSAQPSRIRSLAGAKRNWVVSHLEWPWNTCTRKMSLESTDVRFMPDQIRFFFIWARFSTQGAKQASAKPNTNCDFLNQVLLAQHNDRSSRFPTGNSLRECSRSLSPRSSRSCQVISTPRRS